VRSLRVKFSALVVTLLVLASGMLTAIATQHERQALEDEIENRARMLATYLAGTASDALLGAEKGDFDEELTLDLLVRKVGAGKGVVATRLLDRDGRVVASIVKGERGNAGVPLTAGDDPATAIRSVREDSLLLVATPIYYSDVFVGEAQVVLDLTILIDPLVRSNTLQLAAVAAVVLLIGVGAGLGFVALLVGPLQRLRRGVEQMTHGDVTVRVAPTSRDEVGELTRTFNAMGDSLEQKERIQLAFGRYVNDYVLTQLLQGPEDEQLTGIQREVTILFADIRRFTRLSEGMKAPAVVSLLNDVFQLVSDRILEQGGTIDKFIGDSVMAYFGAPVPHEDHAQRAVRAALDIERAVRDRNRRLGALGDGGARVEIGVGIHMGAVVLGNIGSDRRTDFTVIGDPVNVAHRLEKLARPGEILVSEAVQRRVKTIARLRFEGERQLSGREEPVHVYSIEVDDDTPPESA
jgi:class 3 adenylate cyclase